MILTLQPKGCPVARVLFLKGVKSVPGSLTYFSSNLRKPSSHVVLGCEISTVGIL